MRPSMSLPKREQAAVVGAFTREVQRLRLTQKLAARLVGVTPQALYAWEQGGRIRLKHARMLRVLTSEMQNIKHGRRLRFIGQVEFGELGMFNDLRNAALRAWRE